MQIELTIKPFSGDSLMDVMDRAMSIMLQDPGISITHFKFNGVQLYLRRNGDPAKVEKYYLRKLPETLRHIQDNANDNEYLEEIIGTLRAMAKKRVVLSECVSSFSTGEILLVTEPLHQCEPCFSPFNGWNIDIKISGWLYNE